MGGNNSQQQQQPIQNLNHLTTDPGYQQLLRQLYANNSSSILNDFPQFRGNFNYHPHRNRQHLEVKKATPLKNELYIHKNSIKFVTMYQHKHKEYQTLPSNSIQMQMFQQLSITLQENLHQVKIQLKSKYLLYNFPRIDSQIYNGNNKFAYPSGPGQDFISTTFPLHIEKYNEVQLTTFDLVGGQFPLIITMSKLESVDNKKMFVYASFTLNRDKVFTIETKRIKIERNGKAYIANDVYGVHEQTQDSATDEKECAICLTEKIDTMIIPCKHMCLCRGCCDDLRQRAQKCPICRKTIERFILVERPTFVRQQKKEETVIIEESKDESQSLLQTQQFVEHQVEEQKDKIDNPMVAQDEKKQVEQNFESQSQASTQQSDVFKGQGITIGSSLDQSQI